MRICEGERAVASALLGAAGGSEDGGSLSVSRSQSTPATEPVEPAPMSNDNLSTDSPAARVIVLLIVVSVLKLFVSGTVIAPVTFTPSTSTWTLALGSEIGRAHV